MADETEFLADVCYAKTPLDEPSTKHAEIVALGWKATDRGDPWVVLYGKVFPMGQEEDAVPELRHVMGDYWPSEEEVRAPREG
jgi:hypothetical protein